jgi:hypothetical protein
MFVFIYVRKARVFSLVMCALTSDFWRKKFVFEILIQFLLVSRRHIPEHSNLILSLT